MRFRNIFHNVRVTQPNFHFLLRKYKYAPLPSATCIRLLELVPSVDNRVVQCSLKTFELEEAPPFQAVSYTWGNPETPIPRSSSTISKVREGHLGASKIITFQKEIRHPLPEREPENAGRTPRHAIICDGQIVRVTSNLRDALRMLVSSVTARRSPIPKYYWIDALSMDQTNVEERNAQVARMAEIFKAAQNVLVWLGKEDEFTKDALMTIERISSIPEEEWPLVPYTSFYDPTSAQGHRRHPNLSFHNWLGFIALINRPWFKRAWVVQEIALARAATVFCGTKSFPWNKLSHTLSFIKATKWYHHLHTEKMKHVTKLQKEPGIYKRLLKSKLGVGVGPVYLDATRLKLSGCGRFHKEVNRRPPLRMLLETHRFSKSTDPRDKVYAFLGLADRKMAPFRTQPNAITPDYNLSVQDVYTQTARALLTSYGNLSLLSHVQDPSATKIKGLPSWVPDYSVALDPYPLRYRGPGFWKASGNIPWKMNVFSLEHGELDVRGYRLDYVDQTSVLLDETDDPSASWASIVKLALSLELPYPNPANKRTQPSRVEVLWRTLTTDTYNKTYPAPLQTGSLFIDYILNLQIRHRLMPWSSSDEFQPHHSPLSESIYPEWNTLLQLEPDDSPHSVVRYKERLATVVESMFNGTYSPMGLAQLQHEFDQSGGKRRRLFRTQSNYLGTGPRSLREGDEVWILHGGSVPLVLRRQPDGKYRLIGEAFVYGIMHGEAQAMGLPRYDIVIE